MITLNTCDICGGKYPSVQRDGSSYEHRCAPRELVRVERDGAVVDVPPGELREKDVPIADVTIERVGDRKGLRFVRSIVDGTVTEEESK